MIPSINQLQKPHNSSSLTENSAKTQQSKSSELAKKTFINHEQKKIEQLLSQSMPRFVKNDQSVILNKSNQNEKPLVQKVNPLFDPNNNENILNESDKNLKSSENLDRDNNNNLDNKIQSYSLEKKLIEETVEQYKLLKNRKILVRKEQSHWSEQDIQLLMKYAPIYKYKWALISREIFYNTHSRLACQHKYIASNPKIKHGPWSQNEIDRLLEGYEILGNRWSDIALEYLDGTRTGVQCNLKFLQMEAKSSPKWSKKDDEQLLASFAKFKDHTQRWAKIANDLKNGKNFFQCHLRYTQIMSNLKNWKDGADDLILARGFLELGTQWSKICSSYFNDQYTELDLRNAYSFLKNNKKWDHLIETVKKIKASENNQSSSSIAGPSSATTNNKRKLEENSVNFQREKIRKVDGSSFSSKSSSNHSVNRKQLSTKVESFMVHKACPH